MSFGIAISDNPKMSDLTAITDTIELRDRTLLAATNPDSPPTTNAMSNHPSPKGRFATTRWSMVLKAGDLNAHSQEQALSELCQTYWRPIYGFVYRKCGNQHDAEDLTQSFFIHLMEREALDKVTPENGKFRSFLVACIRNFLAKDWRDRNRIKRGGGKQFVQYDCETEHQLLNQKPYSGVDPEKLFERRWAETVVENAIEKLRKEWESSGKPFAKLLPFLNEPKGTVSYQEVADELSISLAALKSAIHRTRLRFAQLVREEVAETVENPSDIDEEMQYLLRILHA
jgi:RNA polymerase sigma factor (sigma-70 family)